MKRRSSLSSYPTKQFIENELRRAGLNGTETSNHIMIPCPFHRDTNPSLGICLGTGKIPAGVFHCLGCSEKGTWNKLANQLGLRLWGDEETQGNVIAISRSKISIKEEIKDSDFKLSKWDSKWRRYSPEFLHKFKVKKMRDQLNHVDYLYIPLEYGGDIYGYCRARLKKTDPGPKYFFTPNMDKILHPIDELLKQETPVIVLVEGITDAYRLLNARIPALSILGVNLLPIMIEQLEILEAHTIILCMDGDTPGRNAVNGHKLASGKWKAGLKDVLLSKGYRVLVYNLPEGTDPDDAPKSAIKDIRDKVLECNGILYNK